MFWSPTSNLTANPNLVMNPHCQALVVLYVESCDYVFLLLIGYTSEECSGRAPAVSGLPTTGILKGVYEGRCADTERYKCIALFPGPRTAFGCFSVLKSWAGPGNKANNARLGPPVLVPCVHLCIAGLHAVLFSSGGARECSNTGAVPVSPGGGAGTRTAGRREGLPVWLAIVQCGTHTGSHSHTAGRRRGYIAIVWYSRAGTREGLASYGIVWYSLCR